MRVLLFIMLLPSLGIGQGVSFNKAYGNNDYDHGLSIVQLLDSSYVVAGATSSFGSGNTDALLMGIGKEGDLMWQRTFGQEQIEWAQDVVLSSDNFLFTTGYTNDSQGNGYNVLLIKTETDGSHIWTRQYGGSDWDFGYSLIESSDGNIIIAGETYSNSNGENDGYVIKVDAENGDILWEQNFGGSGNDAFYDLVEDLSNGIWFVGYSESNNVNSHLSRTDLTGSLLFETEFDFQVISECSSIDVDQNGDLICSFNYWRNNNEDSISVAAKKIALNGEVIWEHDHGEIDRKRQATNILSRTDNSFILTSNYTQGNFNVNWWPFTEAGWFISQSAITEFGSIEDDEFFNTQSTNDHGIVHVGTTNSWGYGTSSIWVVKQDSLMIAPGTAEDIYVTSIKQPINNYTHLIYPNPSSDHIMIDVPSNIELLEYSIIDNSGKLVQMGLFNSEIDISQLKTGIHLLVLRSQSNFYVSQTFVKQN